MKINFIALKLITLSIVLLDIIVAVALVFVIIDIITPLKKPSISIDRAQTGLSLQPRNTYHTNIPPIFESSGIRGNQTIDVRKRDITRTQKPYSEQAYTPDSGYIREEKLTQDFIAWSKKHGIKLVGVRKPVNDFYYNGATEEDFLPIDGIDNMLEVANGFYKIPEDLLKVMREKTLYISHRAGRGYTVLGSWPQRNILANVDRGSILEQPLSQLQTIHEFAHILDFHGIQGLYNDNNNYWAHLKDIRDDVFEVPFHYDPSFPKPPHGYLDIYSTANSAENFAQHFAFYILHGAKFRSKARNDRLLHNKYEFFKQNLFDGKEY